MIGIYKVTNPKGASYIGQSRNIEKRFQLYAKLKCDEQPKLYNSLRKYGPDLHQFEVLCECSPNELNSLEIYYIALCDTVKNGLNLKHGGHKGGAWSAESKKKLSATLLIVNKKQEVKEKRSAWQRGRKMSPDYCLSLGLRRKGQKGHPNQIAAAAGNNNASKGPVQAFKNGIQIGEFKSTYEAGRSLGCMQQNICKVLSGARAHTMGYFFKRMPNESRSSSVV